MTKHIPRISSTDIYVYNSILVVTSYTPFFRLSRCISSCVIAFIHFFFERIIKEVIIRRTNIRVLKIILYCVYTGVIILILILWIVNKLYLKCIFKIRKHFCSISSNNDNLRNTRFFQLTDLPLNKNFSLYLN